ncbi:MAG: hypothetical protein AB1714_24895 [Acidobacteriota bacterium]
MPKQVANDERSVYETLLWKWLADRLGCGAAQEAWNMAVERARTACPEVPEEMLKASIHSPAVLRHVVNSFRPGKSMPAPDDFAVSIAFECLDLNLETEPVLVRKLANNLHVEWLSLLASQPSLRTYLAETAGSLPGDALRQPSCCDPSLDSILNSPDELRRVYFEGYAVQYGTDAVRVEHPDFSDDLVVRLRSAHKADLGFYRREYDYSLESDAGHDPLRAVYLSDSFGDLCELAFFGDTPHGMPATALLWSR